MVSGHSALLKGSPGKKCIVFLDRIFERFLGQNFLIEFLGRFFDRSQKSPKNIAGTRKIEAKRPF